MSDNFKWTCNGCKQNFPSLTSMTAQLKSIEDTTINRLSIIEDKMNEMQHGMNDKIKEVQLCTWSNSFLQECF
jgi:hypothetical protein